MSRSDYPELDGKTIARVERDDLKLTIRFTDGTVLHVSAGAEAFGAGAWLDVSTEAEDGERP